MLSTNARQPQSIYTINTVLSNNREEKALFVLVFIKLYALLTSSLSINMLLKGD
jgi:hypothetical protein